jgi:hypothetical protein
MLNSEEWACEVSCGLSELGSRFPSDGEGGVPEVNSQYRVLELSRGSLVATVDSSLESILRLQGALRGGAGKVYLSGIGVLTITKIELHCLSVGDEKLSQSGPQWELVREWELVDGDMEVENLVNALQEELCSAADIVPAVPLSLSNVLLSLQAGQSKRVRS